MFSVRSGSVDAQAPRENRESCAYSWKSTRQRLEGAVQLAPQHCLLSKSVTVDQNTNAPKDEPPASFCPEGVRVDMHDPNTWHSMSSGRWLTRSILEASPLPRRVCLKDLHVIHRTVLGVCFHQAHSIHHSYTLAHSAKNGMFAIQPLSGGEGHEELAAIGVWSCIGHRKNPSPSELQVWMKFVFKLFPIDRCATATCPCWVTTLDHEVLDDPVEFGAVVVAPPSQLCKVLAGLWSMLPVQLQHDDPHACLCWWCGVA